MKRLKKNNPILIFLVVFGILVFLHSFGVLRPVENFFLNIFKPVGGQFYNIGNNFSKTYQNKETQDSLLSTVESLKKENAILIVANSKNKETIEENLKLRSQLKFLSDNNFKAVAALVIARESLVEGTEEGQDLIINKGVIDGLSLGQGVVSEEGLIIGKIIEVRNNTSKICLTTSPECKLAAAVQNQTKTQGITDGDLGLTIKMNFIPQLEKISLGDTVITSGLGEKIPRGLVIGKIIEVRNESNEVWQDATIEPLVNLNNLTVVTVIIP
ncbi:MAG: rod shape-determining protein MreC [Patescibacteria group bacterium]